MGSALDQCKSRSRCSLDGLHLKCGPCKELRVVDIDLGRLLLQKNICGVEIGGRRAHYPVRPGFIRVRIEVVIEMTIDALACEYELKNWRIVIYRIRHVDPFVVQLAGFGTPQLQPV